MELIRKQRAEDDLKRELKKQKKEAESAKHEEEEKQKNREWYANYKAVQKKNEEDEERERIEREAQEKREKEEDDLANKKDRDDILAKLTKENDFANDNQDEDGEPLFATEQEYIQDLVETRMDKIKMERAKKRDDDRKERYKKNREEYKKLEEERNTKEKEDREKEQDKYRQEYAQKREKYANSPIVILPGRPNVFSSLDPEEMLTEEKTRVGLFAKEKDNRIYWDIWKHRNELLEKAKNEGFDKKGVVWCHLSCDYLPIKRFKQILELMPNMDGFYIDDKVFLGHQYWLMLIFDKARCEKSLLGKRKRDNAEENEKKKQKLE